MTHHHRHHDHRHQGPRAGAAGCGTGPRARGRFNWRLAGRGFSAGFEAGDGEFRGWRGGSGGFGGGRRRGRVLDGAQLQLVLLALIAEEPRHGYELIRAIEERTGGAYAPSPGVVYPTLAQLLDMDLVAEAENGSSRRSYTITEAGTAYLTDRRGEADAALARLDAMREAPRDGGAAPVMRAMANLAIALRQQMAGGADRERGLAIAAMIDELTGRIERL